MTTDNKEIWIRTGYENFALEGLSGLKIEPLAKKVGKSKSSFYHHFAEVDYFIDFLLKLHIENTHIISVKERNAQNIDPELINTIIEHKLDFLFNKQLRLYQNLKLFPETLNKSNKIVGNLLTMEWTNHINKRLTKTQTDAILSLVIENFFFQITVENLNQKWLSEYFLHLNNITSKLI
jgi:AcrR family transcriptional regulator